MKRSTSELLNFSSFKGTKSEAAELRHRVPQWANNDEGVFGVNLSLDLLLGLFQDDRS